MTFKKLKFILQPTSSENFFYISIPITGIEDRVWKGVWNGSKKLNKGNFWKEKNSWNLFELINIELL